MAETMTRGRVRVEHGHKRVRAYLGGELVADTTKPAAGLGGPLLPRLLLTGQRTSGPTWCPPARPTTRPAAAMPRYSTCAGRPATAPVRRGDMPASPIEELRDAVRLDWDAMDEWLEEDEPVYTHPRDPYTRVDILASSRHVQVVVDGVTVADSYQPEDPV